MSRDADADGGDSPELFDLLIEPTTREILVAVDDEPLSAKDLAERCDVSGPTMYRRVNAMEEFDLVRSGTEIDPNGNHYTVYESNVDQIEVEIDPSDGEVSVDLTYRYSTDQFIHLWEGLRNQ